MENDTIITIGLIGIGAYAAYKLLGETAEGVKKTGNAVGDTATAAGSTVQDMFKPLSAVSNAETSTIKTLTSDAGNLYAEGKKDVTGIYREIKSGVTGLYSSVKAAAAGLYNSTATFVAPSPQPIYNPQPYVNYTPAPANFSSISGRSVYVPDIYTLTHSAGATSSPKMFTSSNYTPAKTTSSKSSSSSIIGAKVGTIFPSGSYVVSSGPSGKYSK